MIVGNPIIMILKAILNWFRLRRNYIANAVDKIPPEIKDAIVAWYSPVKQKLTNYDVIESYAEDFTSNNWKHTNSVTVTNNSFHLTYGKLRYELYPNTTYNTKPMTVIVKGLIGIKGFIRYRYGQKYYVDINKDGIYYLPAKVDDTNVLGFQTHFKSECDITITQLPTSILKDFSGNGNHAYLYGGKGKLNSGMGVYNEDFLTFMVQGGINNPNVAFYSNKVIIDNIKGKTNFWKDIKNAPIGKVTYPSYKIRFSGLPENTKTNVEIRYGDDYSQRTTVSVINNKIITIPEVTANVITPNKNYNYFNVHLYSIESIITIEQIPDYPDQLCYDGKMYAVCYDFPILTDYTVMAERTWFEIGNNSCFASKRIGANKGAFAIEYRKLYAENFGSYNAITFVANKKEIIVQSKEKYNDKDLIAGNEIDTNQLLIGGISLNNNRLNEPYIGCHGDILLFNRTLTDDELDLVKKHFFGIVRIKDALLTVDDKPIITTDNKYIKLNKK